MVKYLATCSGGDAQVSPNDFNRRYRSATVLLGRVGDLLDGYDALSLGEYILATDFGRLSQENDVEKMPHGDGLNVVNREFIRVGSRENFALG